MPSIKLAQLDTTILAAVKNFKGVKLPGVKGPIINGIIVNPLHLGNVKPLTLAREIVQAIPLADGVQLKPTTKALGDGKILVGFQINTPV